MTWDERLTERVPSGLDDEPNPRACGARGKFRLSEAGASIEMAPTEQFYGKRSAVLCDPFGHRRNIGQSLEEVSPEKMQKRSDYLMASGGP